MVSNTPITAIRRSGPRLFSLLLVTAGLLSASASTLPGQAAGSLAGRVLSQENLLPLSGASVLLEGSGRRFTTDDGGAFHIPGVPAGRVVLRIERDGYISLVESVTVTPMEVSLVQFQLHRIGALLEELSVVADRQPGDRPPGHSQGEAPSENDGARTAADLLIRSIPGMSLLRSGGSVGSSVRVSLRGVSSLTLTDQPSVYLDGVRIDDGAGTGGEGLGEAVNVLDQIPAGEVRRIRILRGPAAASGYANSAAGVILVETIRSRSPGSR